MVSLVCGWLEGERASRCSTVQKQLRAAGRLLLILLRQRACERGADSASRGAERGSRGMVVMVGALEVAGSPLPFQLQTVLSIIS